MSMYGIFGVAIDPAPALAPVLHAGNNAVTRFFINLHSADWFITLGSLANALVIVWLVVATWRVPTPSWARWRNTVADRASWAWAKRTTPEPGSLPLPSWLWRRRPAVAVAAATPGGAPAVSLLTNGDRQQDGTQGANGNPTGGIQAALTGAHDVVTVAKPWGQEELLVQTDQYVVKRITILAGHRTSLELHERKHETIFVLEGSVEMELDGTTHHLSPGDHLVVEPNKVHHITASPSGSVVVLESGTPEMDDTVSLEDDYGTLEEN